MYFKNKKQIPLKRCRFWSGWYNIGDEWCCLWRSMQKALEWISRCCAGGRSAVKETLAGGVLWRINQRFILQICVCVWRRPSQKLDRLIRAAGMETIDFKNKFAAIKIHFGEPGNLAFLRPNFSKVVADLVKEKAVGPSWPTVIRCMSAGVRMRLIILKQLMKTDIARFRLVARWLLAMD